MLHNITADLRRIKLTQQAEILERRAKEAEELGASLRRCASAIREQAHGSIATPESTTK